MSQALKKVSNGTAPSAFLNLSIPELLARYRETQDRKAKAKKQSMPLTATQRAKMIFVRAHIVGAYYRSRPVRSRKR